MLWCLEQPHGESGGLDAKRLHNLWTEVAKLAFKHQHSALVRQACLVVRGVTWDHRVNREMVIQQSEVDLLFAETMGRDVAATTDDIPSTVDGEHGNDDTEDAEDDEAQKRVSCSLELLCRAVLSLLQVRPDVHVMCRCAGELDACTFAVRHFLVRVTDVIRSVSGSMSPAGV
jgi:hypothetical protein